MTDHSLVVAMAEDCTTANTVATSVSVMGPERGLAFAQSKRACVRIVRKPTDQIEVRQSECFRQFVIQ
jgi:thiamine biosynthesis lipoprotein